MTDFTPTPEAVEAAAKSISADRGGEAMWKASGEYLRDKRRSEARAAIAAFVEAEGLRIETDEDGYTRIVGEWRRPLEEASRFA